MPNKETSEQCAYCLTLTDDIGITGKVAIDKSDTLKSYVVCKACCKKSHASGFDATKVVQHKKRFWERVHQNVKTLAKK